MYYYNMQRVLASYAHTHALIVMPIIYRYIYATNQKYAWITVLNRQILQIVLTLTIVLPVNITLPTNTTV